MSPVDLRLGPTLELTLCLLVFRSIRPGYVEMVGERCGISQRYAHEYVSHIHYCGRLTVTLTTSFFHARWVVYQPEAVCHCLLASLQDALD